MPDQPNHCDKENMISQLLKVQAQITVTPLVKHGDPKVSCIDSFIRPSFGCCDHDSFDYDDYCDCHCDCCNHSTGYDTVCESRRKPACNFTLTQLICVEIPISMDVDVDIQEGILCCDRPEVESTNDDRKTDNKIDRNRKKPFFMQMI